MEHLYRTHKEPAWGWIGALLASQGPAVRPDGVRRRRRQAARV